MKTISKTNNIGALRDAHDRLHQATATITAQRLANVFMARLQQLALTEAHGANAAATKVRPPSARKRSAANPKPK